MITTRGYVSIVLGVVVGILGIIPLLHQFGIIGFTLPTLPGLIMGMLLVAGGIFLLIDSVHEIHMRWVSVVLGIIVIFMGVLPTLMFMGVIGFSLNFIPEFIKNVLYVLIGIFLLFGAGD